MKRRSFLRLIGLSASTLAFVSPKVNSVKVLDSGEVEVVLDANETITTTLDYNQPVESVREGDLWFDTSKEEAVIKLFDGSEWVKI